MKHLANQSRSRLVKLLLVCVAPLLFGADATDDPDLARLRAMPRSERERLWANLKRFDRASRADQAIARELDRRLAEVENPSQKSRYYDVLRRYHLWFETLSESKREQLRKAPPEQRMELVSKFMAEQKGQRKLATPMLVLHIASIGTFSPLDIAMIYQVWQSVPPTARAEFDDLNPAEFRNRMVKRGAKHKAAIEESLSRKYKEEDWIDRIEKRQQRPLRLEQVAKAKLVGDEAKRQLALNLYFLENPPKGVSSANLALFLDQLPKSVRSTFDVFPPDELKRRLTISYRLIYPDSEIPSPQKPANQTAKGTSGAVPPSASGSVPKPATAPPTTQPSAPAPATPF